MKKIALHLTFICLLLFASCNKDKIAQLEQEVASKDEKIEFLEKELQDSKNSANNMMNVMKDLSVVNKEGAESIRKSLENITYVNSRMQYKDSLNFELVRNLKRSLSDINDQDVQVEVKGGIVYVSISDKLLFNSGSSRVTSAAQDVLGKIALVLNDHSDLNVLVEGHTDNVPMKPTECVSDNWDLSADRAVSVVRILQNDHYVSPERLTAAGRSSFVPRVQNDSSEGRATNRRTEILILPRFDQFFKLMESPELAD